MFQDDGVSAEWTAHHGDWPVDHSGVWYEQSDDWHDDTPHSTLGHDYSEADPDIHDGTTVPPAEADLDIHGYPRDNIYLQPGPPTLAADTSASPPVQPPSGFSAGAATAATLAAVDQLLQAAAASSHPTTPGFSDQRPPRPGPRHERPAARSRERRSHRSRSRRRHRRERRSHRSRSRRQHRSPRRHRRSDHGHRFGSLRRMVGRVVERVIRRRL